MSFSLSCTRSPSLFFRLIPWSTEALWVHFPAQASKTLSRRCSAPSPHQEGAWGLREQSKPHAGALLAFRVNQGISASFSPLLSYHRLQTTRFWFVKGPQHTTKNFIWCVSTGFLYSKSHWTCRLSQQVRSVKYNIEWKSHVVWNQWVWLWALDLSLIS